MDLGVLRGFFLFAVIADDGPFAAIEVHLMVAFVETVIGHVPQVLVDVATRFVDRVKQVAIPVGDHP